jgi:hypothetical protein
MKMSMVVAAATAPVTPLTMPPMPSFTSRPNRIAPLVVVVVWWWWWCAVLRAFVAYLESIFGCEAVQLLHMTHIVAFSILKVRWLH